MTIELLGTVLFSLYFVSGMVWCISFIVENYKLLTKNGETGKARKTLSYCLLMGIIIACGFQIGLKDEKGIPGVLVTIMVCFIGMFVATLGYTLIARINERKSSRL